MQIAISLRHLMTRSIAHRIITILVSSTLIAIAAQISIPLEPVPVTLQTLVILLVGALYGPRLAAEIVGTYILAAGCGLPILADGNSLFTLPVVRYGYIAGFFLTAIVTGYLYERIGKRFVGRLTAIFLGAATVYIPGLIWLAKFIGIEAAVSVGLLPFVFGDILKATLAFLTAEVIARRS